MTASRAQLSGPTLLAAGVVVSVAVASFMRAPLLPAHALVAVFFLGAVVVVVACLVVPAGRRRPRAARARPGDDAAPGLSRSRAITLAAVPFAVFFTLSAVPQTLLPVIGSSELALSTAFIGLALGAGGLARLAAAAEPGT